MVPGLVLVVERDCITVLNNETGFQDQNIRAICDVGRSTKGKHKYGYIGISLLFLIKLLLCRSYAKIRSRNLWGPPGWQRQSSNGLCSIWFTCSLISLFLP